MLFITQDFIVCCNIIVVINTSFLHNNTWYTDKYSKGNCYDCAQCPTSLQDSSKYYVISDSLNSTFHDTVFGRKLVTSKHTSEWILKSLNVCRTIATNSGNTSAQIRWDSEVTNRFRKVQPYLMKLRNLENVDTYSFSSKRSSIQANINHFLEVIRSELSDCVSFEFISNQNVTKGDKRNIRSTDNKKQSAKKNFFETRMRNVTSLRSAEKKKQPKEKREFVIENENCTFLECSIGNYIADSLVTYFAKDCKSEVQWTEVAVSFVLAASIRSNLTIKADESDLKERVGKVLYQPDNLDIITLTGSQLEKILKLGLRKVSHSRGKTFGHPGFLQLSGLRLKNTITYDGKSVGVKIHQILVLCAQCKTPSFSTLVPTETYKVIIQRQMRTDQYGYKDIFDKAVIQETKETDENAIYWFTQTYKNFIPGRSLRVGYDMVEVYSVSSRTGAWNLLFCGILFSIFLIL